MALTTATSSSLGPRRRDARFAVDIDMYDDSPKTIRVSNVRFSVHNYTKDDVASCNERFIDTLKKIREKIERLGENVRQPLPEGLNLLEELREVGADAFSLLGERATEEIRKIEEDVKDRGISLDFKFPPEMSCLWELMYPGDPFRKMDHQEDPQKFWGFRYPIGRSYDNISMRDRVRLRKGVFASSHSQLIHTDEELTQLKQKIHTLRDLLDLEVCFQRLEEAIPSDTLNLSEIMGFFSGDKFGYGVVHFACHCVHPSSQIADAAQAYLLFSAHQQDVQITVNKFQTAKQHNYGFREHPLVFLNACGSATPQYLQSLKFPNVLIDFGAGGVIATACMVPDTFASAFASEFYSRLLDKYIADAQIAKQIDTPEALLNVLERPTYISETLFETRWHFWNTYQNPLGLAYGLYAQSDQQFWLI